MIYRGHVPAPVPERVIRLRNLAGPADVEKKRAAEREALRRAFRSGVRGGIVLAAVIIYFCLWSVLR